MTHAETSVHLYCQDELFKRREDLKGDEVLIIGQEFFIQAAGRRWTTTVSNFLEAVRPSTGAPTPATFFLRSESEELWAVLSAMQLGTPATREWNHVPQKNSEWERAR